MRFLTGSKKKRLLVQVRPAVFESLLSVRVRKVPGFVICRSECVCFAKARRVGKSVL